MRFKFCGLLVCLCSFSLLASAAERIRPSSPEFPSVSLPEHVHGAAAIQALGGQLLSVAKAYGMTEEKLRDRLLHDRHLHVDKHGRLFYADDFELPEGAATATEPAAAASVPLSDTFLLHSKPGAKRVIFLDFDGYVMSGNAWAAGYNGGSPINCPPWDIDGDPTTFSDTERTRIQEIWQRVAEDYAPFDVDVTTQDPGDAALARSSSTDDVYGTRVLISPISSYFGNYGGIAYVGVYDNVGTYYQPALVFPENLANGAKYIAEACAHECGHNLGLSHDGTTTGSAYYSGHGSGEIGWAPIMGVGYYQNVTQWSKGEYANANNTEDDLAVIQSNGLSYRADDYGDDNNSATFLPAGTTISATGIIERNTDNDVIAFSTGAGTITLNASPALPGPNLDILALLYNATGTLISSNNPAELACSFSVSIPAGTYYLHIRGTGYLTPTNGYSSYASLGQYTVTGTVPNPTGAIAPVAFPTATPPSATAPLSVNFSGSQSYDQDGSIISYQWTFGDGATGSGLSVSHTYAAATSTAPLPVTDNPGLTDSHSVTITASAPNIVPTAVVSATPTSGTAPLTVSFNGSGSYDADGSIARYPWNFADGKTGRGATASHTR